jgi:SAM-dependent methyltransferase
MPTSARQSSPQAAFGDFADHYDAYTEHPLYARWIVGLEALARRHGLTGRRVLDAGCGTGKSFLPLLDLGYEVTGCDASEAMLAHARRKAGGRARLVAADLTNLPRLGRFDLVVCLNDVCNYLASPGALRAALRGMAANLRPGGLLLLDANTPAAYRTVFAEVHRRERDGRVFVWDGSDQQAFEPGSAVEVALEVFARRADGAYDRLVSRHRQRHHPRELLLDAFRYAGLAVEATYGQHNDGRRDPVLDEAAHFKAIYFGRRRSDPAEEVSLT